MPANIAAQQNLAARLANVLRRFEHEGGALETLARAVGETPRDLRRWAEGTKCPAHVLVMLLGELPRHLADELIRPTGLRLVAREVEEDVNALMASAAASDLSGAVARALADNRIDHRERAALQDIAQRAIAKIQPLAGE